MVSWDTHMLLSTKTSQDNKIEESQQEDGTHILSSAGVKSGYQ
jgi:hypothetical protein